MSKIVLVTLNSGLGADLGDDFVLSANTGTTFPTGATRTELLAGVSVTVDDDTATTITVTSLGTCTNALNLTITVQTSTTTSTTLAP